MASKQSEANSLGLIESLYNSVNANRNSVRSNYSFSKKSMLLMPKTRGFKMASLNIASVPKHIDEIRLLLNDQSPDLICFNETRLDSTISSGEMYINGYDLVRRDRKRKGGGACIYLKNTVNYKNRKDLVPPELEAVCVEISKPNSKPFIVITIYRPPDSSTEYFDKVEEFIATIDSLDREFYILGDLNCNWLQPADPVTKRLKTFCDLYQLLQLINEPTRITETSSSLLDVVITSHPERIINSGVSHLGLSDHSLVYAIRKINAKTSRKQIKIIDSS